MRRLDDKVANHGAAGCDCCQWSPESIFANLGKWMIAVRPARSARPPCAAIRALALSAQPFKETPAPLTSRTSPDRPLPPSHGSPGCFTRLPHRRASIGRVASAVAAPAGVGGASTPGGVPG
jgi:hypothetical protein